jgi:hypothetical protein
MELLEREKGKKNDRATIISHIPQHKMVEDTRMCIERY